MEVMSKMTKRQPRHKKSAYAMKMTENGQGPKPTDASGVERGGLEQSWKRDTRDYGYD